MTLAVLSTYGYNATFAGDRDPVHLSSADHAGVVHVGSAYF